MPDITQAKILILATDGFEQSELTVPLETLKAAGATVQPWPVPPSKTAKPTLPPKLAAVVTGS